LFVLAGASEFMFVAIIASGGNPLAAAVAGLLVNARHFPFGIAVRDLAGTRLKGLLGCHIMNDESVVFGLSQSTPKQRKDAYWLCGLGVAIVWPVGAMAGSVVGKLLPDINAIGLDVVFPAILLALVIPSLKSKTTLIRASSGALLSLAVTPFVAVGMPVLISMLGLLTRKK
jgi:predicted branched-subunit amino acid permease